jgi:hypothetical protein
MGPPASFETHRFAMLLRMRRSENRSRRIHPDPNFQTAQPDPVSRAVSRRSFPSSLSMCAPQKRGARSLLPKEGAERRKRRNLLSVLPRGSTCQPCEASSPYGAPLRRFRRWDPSASPTCHGYYPMALGRRRDGRFHPAPLSGRGGLLHPSPGTRLARPCARAPHPIHIRSPAGRPSANGDTSAILMRPGSVKQY